MTIWYQPPVLPAEGELVLCVMLSNEIPSLEAAISGKAHTQLYYKVYFGPRNGWSLGLAQYLLELEDLETVSSSVFPNLSLKGGAAPAAWAHVYGTS